MVRFATGLATFCLAESVRISSLDSVVDEMATMVMMETIAAANGMMNMTASAALNPLCESQIWDPKMNGQFTNRRVVGSGATACVWLGVDSTGTTVAIKVGKNPGAKGANAALAAWSAECRDMQLLRLMPAKQVQALSLFMKCSFPHAQVSGPHPLAVHTTSCMQLVRLVSRFHPPNLGILL